MNLSELLEKLSRLAASSVEKGRAFERMMATYLTTDPTFATRFDKVFLWSDWPDRPQDMSDIGIDLVGIERDGGVCAIQCKFIAERREVSKPDVDTFLSVSSKKFFTSRLIIATTDHWNRNAMTTLADQVPPVSRLGLSDLLTSPIDWVQFDPQQPERLNRLDFRELLPHQRDAIVDINDGFRDSDRGKLIMACGTGKTFTSLRLAEELVGRGGHILFLVPSIALVSQALREWTREARLPLQVMAVCSDIQVAKDAEDVRVFDLALPATTDPKRLASHLETATLRAQSLDEGEAMFVTFSTYQSLSVIERAQREFGFPEFDLIICDEAHRTAGVSGVKEDSNFILVHDDTKILARRRLFMTATPKVYGEKAKSKAADDDIILYSMDNEAHFGPEFHRLGFGEAVRRKLLSDYRVVILAIDQDYAAQTLYPIVTSKAFNIDLPDAAKLLGCWLGLAKISDQPDEFAGDPEPMKTGVIFVNKIEDSKQIRSSFVEVVAEAHKTGIGVAKNLPDIEIKHIDGTMGALERNGDINWLRETSDTCRLLTNARCLSEGVDVPSLDAVMFLQPRKSQVDVVQAVGRVMRRAPGKNYGYVILPVVVPSNVDPDEALDNNKDFEVVWQILQALKSHDERFEAVINSFSRGGGSTGGKVDVIGVTGKTKERDQSLKETVVDDLATQIRLWPEEIEQAIYARISRRLSTERYWPTWAKDVAALATRYEARIREAANRSPEFLGKLEALVQSLQDNINPSLGTDDAVEMLSQHLITKPVFDALFEGSDFIASNPVSLSLEEVVDYLRTEQDSDREAKSLEAFYQSVRSRAATAQTKEQRQRLVKDLYENFFQGALKKTTDRMGIAYTPIEIVDFMLRSVDELVEIYFGTRLSNQGVHVLDPFTGTGTFPVRLIELGLLGDNLPEKYRSELHANEILLLAYYIAAVNIESAYHSTSGAVGYDPFAGIVFTDTFQLNEFHDHLGTAVFKANSDRIDSQRKAPITVIVANPPYAVGQQTANDNAKRLEYRNLDKRIEATYVAKSSAVGNRSLYDSYVRALRWASDRIGDAGIVCFVTNGGWLRGNSGQGIRASFEEEFDAVYVFDLRGNQRTTSGEQSRQEGGKVFNQASRVPVTILVLIRGSINEEAQKGIFYHDVGDYLTREKKLEILSNFGSASTVPWTTITPNPQHDWLGQRSQEWEKFVPLAEEGAIFTLHSNGLVSSRDAWAYNSSQVALSDNMTRTVATFNSEVEGYRQDRPTSLDSWINKDSTLISWSRGLKQDLVRRAQSHSGSVAFDAEHVRVGLYRPFFKQWVYFDKQFNEMRNQLPHLYPTGEIRNPAILVTGRGAGAFGVLATDITPNLDTIEKTHVFARYRYETSSSDDGALFGAKGSRQTRLDNIESQALAKFQVTYDDGTLTKDDLFAYIYGLLNHPGYQAKYANNLTKDYPRVTWISGHRELIALGKQLLDLHIDYESVEPYPLEETFSMMAPEDPSVRYRATEMKHPSRRSGARGKDDWDRTRIVVNPFLTLSGVPEEATSWILGPRPALELFLQRMKPSVDKASGIRNDPNDISDSPNYVVDLTKKVVRVCVETVRLRNELPEYLELPQQ